MKNTEITLFAIKGTVNTGLRAEGILLASAATQEESLALNLLAEKLATAMKVPLLKKELEATEGWCWMDVLEAWNWQDVRADALSSQASKSLIGQQENQVAVFWNDQDKVDAMRTSLEKDFLPRLQYMLKTGAELDDGEFWHDVKMPDIKASADSQDGYFGTDSWLLNLHVTDDKSVRLIAYPNYDCRQWIELTSLMVLANKPKRENTGNSITLLEINNSKDTGMVVNGALIATAGHQADDAYSKKAHLLHWLADNLALALDVPLLQKEFKLSKDWNWHDVFTDAQSGKLPDQQEETKRIDFWDDKEKVDTMRAALEADLLPGVEHKLRVGSDWDLWDEVEIPDIKTENGLQEGYFGTDTWSVDTHIANDNTVQIVAYTNDECDEWVELTNLMALVNNARQQNTSEAGEAESPRP